MFSVSTLRKIQLGFECNSWSMGTQTKGKEQRVQVLLFKRRREKNRTKKKRKEETGELSRAHFTPDTSIPMETGSHTKAPVRASVRQERGCSLPCVCVPAEWRSPREPSKTVILMVSFQEKLGFCDNHITNFGKPSVPTRKTMRPFLKRSETVHFFTMSKLSPIGIEC